MTDLLVEVEDRDIVVRRPASGHSIRYRRVLEVDRKVIPYPYPTRKDAVDAIESVVTTFPQSGYQSENDSWWAETVLASGSP